MIAVLLTLPPSTRSTNEGTTCVCVRAYACVFVSHCVLVAADESMKHLGTH